MTDFASSDAIRAPASAASAGKVVIVASAPELAALRAADGDGRFAGASCHALDAGEPIPAELLAGACVLVLEVDPAIPASLQRLRILRSEQRGLPLIAALRGMDVLTVRTLVRQGIADVTELPFRVADLAAQVAEAGESAAASPDRAGLAPMICVVGSVGGCGTTTVITHLAALLSSRKNLSVCVVDLDLQGGEVAYYAGQNPRITVASLIEAGDRLDTQFTRSALGESGHGFSLIAAPENVMPLDEVDVAQLLRMLGILRQMFDAVLVDLPTDWTNWGLSVASASSEVVLVTDLSLASLRQTRRRLDLFESVGIEAERLSLVANRVEHKLFGAVGLTEAATALGREFAAELADEGTAIRAAQDEGRLLFDARRRTRFEAGLCTLADKLVGPEG